MFIKTLPTAEEAMQSAARDIAVYINENPDSLLCFAAGNTPLPLFKRLLELQRGGEVNLGGVYYVGLDEWLGVGRETTGSCAQVMYDNYYAPAGVPDERVCVWNGLCADTSAEIARIGAWINGRGGIALALLGVGMNGHVGFNEPNVAPAEGGVLVRLAEATLSASTKYFVKALPATHGLTVGLAELKKARKLLLAVTGAAKAGIVKKFAYGGANPAVPASLLMDHPDVTLYADEAAMADVG